MYRSFSPAARCAADSVNAQARALNIIFSGAYTTDLMASQVDRLTRELELAARALRELAKAA
jgi:hypothetical protein